MAKPKTAAFALAKLSADNIRPLPTHNEEQPLSAEQHSFLQASLDAACMDAAEAGWDATIQALELVLAAAADAGSPSNVSLDTIKLAEAQISSALAEMQRVGKTTDQLRNPSPSTKHH